jgi:hypothetical protein
VQKPTVAIAVKKGKMGRGKQIMAGNTGRGRKNAFFI